MSLSSSPPIEARLRSTFRHLYADIFWFGVLSGSSLAFLNIYLTRLGATGFEISVVTAGPAVVNLFFSLPAGKWLGGRSLHRATFYSAVFQRLGFLALIPLGWIFAERQQLLAAIAITIMMSVPGTLLAISFNALFAELVPADQRADLVGKRNAVVAVSMTSTTLLCGQVLDRILFPLNYQVVFMIGALGAVISSYHLARLRPFSGDRQKKDDQSGLKREIEHSVVTPPVRGSLLRLDLLRGRFGGFMAAYLAFYTFQFLAIPLFPLAFVRLLNLTDGEISLGSSLFYGVMMLTSLRLGGLSKKFGNHRLLAIGGLCFAVYPLLIGSSRGPTLYWVASFLGGGVWAVISASLVNRLMEVAGEADRPASMALHNLTLNLGILLGSLSASLANAGLGLQNALLLAGGLRLLGGILLALFG